MIRPHYPAVPNLCFAIGVFVGLGPFVAGLLSPTVDYLVSTTNALPPNSPSHFLSVPLLWWAVTISSISQSNYEFLLLTVVPTVLSAIFFYWLMCKPGKKITNWAHNRFRYILFSAIAGTISPLLATAALLALGVTGLVKMPFALVFFLPLTIPTGMILGAVCGYFYSREK